MTHGEALDVFGNVLFQVAITLQDISKAFLNEKVHKVYVEETNKMYHRGSPTVELSLKYFERERNKNDNR